MACVTIDQLLNALRTDPWLAMVLSFSPEIYGVYHPRGKTTTASGIALRHFEDQVVSRAILRLRIEKLFGTFNPRSLHPALYLRICELRKEAGLHE